MKRFATPIVFVFAFVALAEPVELKTGAASCIVELDGARITSFRVAGDEMLWNADPVQLDAKDWAHGGIPVCWPWFGVDDAGRIHGYAWRRRFCIRNRRDGETLSEINLFLNVEGARLDYRIALSDALTLELAASNVGTNDLSLSMGFHPYFMVSERDRTAVHGLDGLRFEDDPSRPAPGRGVWHGTLPVTASVDRIFSVCDRRKGVYRLEDMLAGRAVLIEVSGASDINVWNPGVEKNCPGSVPGDTWRRFVCVEPILVGPDGKVTLGPGKTRRLRMTVTRRRAP